MQRDGADEVYIEATFSSETLPAHFKRGFKDPEVSKCSKILIVICFFSIGAWEGVHQHQRFRIICANEIHLHNLIQSILQVEAGTLSGTWVT